jgi:formylglycine-generating enzyme
MNALARLACITLALTLSLACRKKSEEVLAVPEVTVARATRPGAVSVAQAKPGMAFIPQGSFKAGTPPGAALRIADEEMPGTPVEMGGFYIDMYPYPNESGAIPTANVSREDAAKLCAAKSKRLCTELEWERACKGPESTTYEYGSTYKADACATGALASARRPNGERSSCRSAFGVFDMHGGVWEWTESTWARRPGEAEMGVVRGGNARAGELTGRCANAQSRATALKQATVGFRCCAGPRNEAAVVLSPATLAAFERRPDREVETIVTSLAPVSTTLWGSSATSASDYSFERAWYWRPVASEELVVALGCEKQGGPWAHCGVVVARIIDERATLLAQFATGPHIPDLITKDSEPKHIRARGIDIRGTFARDFEYIHGRIRVAEESRP